MICAVNLLPDSCLEPRRRAIRRNAWIVVVSAASLLVIGVWIGLRSISRVADRQKRQHDGVLIKQTDLDRRLMLAAVTRNELARRAGALVALRQDQESGGLPRQLFTLSRLAPDGVILTEICSSSSMLSSRMKKLPPGAETKSGNVVVRIAGYAADHDELTLLIDAIQHVERWGHVELIRAAREPYMDISALFFELECRQMENAK